MRTLADIQSNLATPEEVAEVVPFTVQTIQRGLRSGKIPGTKFCGRWFVNVPRLAEQLAGETSRPPVQSGPAPGAATSRPHAAGRVDETPVPVEAAGGSATSALPAKSERLDGDPSERRSA